MTRCQRCIVRNDSPGVVLDDQGLCNICRIWDSMAPKLTDYTRLQQVFRAKLDAVRGRFPYDAVVGLSGGKDGAYLVYALTKIYQLKVLAVTFDMGFMPNEFARQNAIRVTRALCVDHEFVSLPKPLVDQIFRGYLGGMTHTTPCHLCTSILGLAGAFRFALDHGVPKIMAGLDRGQLLNKLHLTHARTRVLDNIAPFDRHKAQKQIEKAIHQVNLYLRWLGLSTQQRASIVPAGATLPGSDEVPELMMYFLYHPYNEEEIKKTLETEVGWVRPSGDVRRGHFDCDLKKVAQGASARLGLGERLEYELSVDIREGSISREEALIRLQQDHDAAAAVQRPFQAVETCFGLSEAVFERKVKRLARIAPAYAWCVNRLIRTFGLRRVLERMALLIRPH